MKGLDGRHGQGQVDPEEAEAFEIGPHSDDEDAEYERRSPVSNG